MLRSVRRRGRAGERDPPRHAIERTCRSATCDGRAGLLRRLRDEVRARDPDGAYARGCLRGTCAAGRGVAYVRHDATQTYSLHVGAFGPRGELEGPGVLCAGGALEDARDAVCAGGVYAGRFRNDSMWKGTLADSGEAYAGEFGVDLQYEGLGVRTVSARTRVGEFRRGAWRRAQRAGFGEDAQRAARGAAQAAKAAAALFHDPGVWTKRRSRCMLCAPDGDARARPSLPATWFAVPAPPRRAAGAALALATFIATAWWAYRRRRRLAARSPRVS